MIYVCLRSVATKSCFSALHKDFQSPLRIFHLIRLRVGQLVFASLLQSSTASDRRHNRTFEINSETKIISHTPLQAYHEYSYCSKRSIRSMIQELSIKRASGYPHVIFSRFTHHPGLSRYHLIMVASWFLEQNKSSSYSVRLILINGPLGKRLTRLLYLRFHSLYIWYWWINSPTTYGYQAVVLLL